MDEERLAILEDIANCAKWASLAFKTTDDWAYNMRMGALIQRLARLENYDDRPLDLGGKTKVS